jgi:hypothetical protein
MPGEPETLDQLSLPKTDPRSIAQSFGPGLILMMTGIGTSHLVTARARLQILRVRDGVPVHAHDRAEHARRQRDGAQ